MLNKILFCAACLTIRSLSAEFTNGSIAKDDSVVVRLGALFAVHGAPEGAGGACGAVREHYGIQRVEATLQTLDSLGALQGTYGVRVLPELRDSCWAPPTALRQALHLLRRCDPSSGTGGVELGGAAPLLGVLGPGASAAAAHVQNLLQLFGVPQLSYSATARELSDRARYATFFRVAPSDLHQARLLVALLRAHNYTYVHAAHTDESYGQSGMAAFREEAARGGVCVAREIALRAAPGAREAEAAAERLLASPPGVALCWCEGRTARALLAALAARGGDLRLVASDGWADRRAVVAGLEQAAARALTVRIRSPYLTHFDTHYLALKPHNNSRNPWFREFWEQKFNCSLNEEPPNGTARCTGAESLATNYTQEPKLALVVRGVLALWHALRDMLAAECGGRSESTGGSRCPATAPFNRSLFLQYLARVRFRAPDGGLVAFDENGDPPAELSEYDVMEWRHSAAKGWHYARVGRWRRGRLLLRGGHGAAVKRAAGVNATCSRACGAGQWARRGEGRARCCWTCVPCPAHAVPRAAGCRACPPGARPDLARARCLPAPLEWGGGQAARVALLALRGAASLGLTLTLATAAVLWRYRSTPVVKSASRELCALLLGCAAACQVSALAATARPSSPACALSRVAAPALGGVYAAVLARTARVARLVAAAAGRRPRLMSSRAQVGTWAALVAPGAAAAAWSAGGWSPAPRVLHPARGRAVLACGGEDAAAQLVPLAPALALLAACVALAVRTRKLPHNFNETRFIGAAAYATCVVWAALVPVYAAAEARALVLGAGVAASAVACVALGLGPRVFVCLFRPSRNTRAHFLTATSIRCHLGKYKPGTEPEGTSPPAGDVGDRPPPSRRCAGGDGACARVTAAPAPDGHTDVLIVLLPHAHSH